MCGVYITFGLSTLFAENGQASSEEAEKAQPQENSENEEKKE